ncbi:MAG: DUF814 domain-containing protein [Candidatus Kapabacteria bacterium]|nr:DUF814 domain-containing protein [Candidatus Kapabacteria bacterium]
MVSQRIGMAAQFHGAVATLNAGLLAAAACSGNRRKTPLRGVATYTEVRADAVIRHYLTLEHLAHALHRRLAGAQLLEAFSQEKHVLTLCFLKDGAEIVITVSVDPTYGTILERTNIRRARSNTLDRFDMLCGMQCAHVTKHADDRIVSFWFDTFVMHALFFGSGHGNIVVTRDGIIVDALTNAKQLIGTTFAVAAAGTPPLGNLYEAERDHVSDVEAACRESTTYYVLRRGDDVVFSLLPLHGWDVLEQYDDINAALRRTVGIRRTTARLKSMRTQLLTELRRRIARTERSLRGMQSDVANVDRTSMYRHYGNLLMAQGTDVHIKGDRITVQDVDGSMVTISIDPTRSLIENATSYYAKAKQSVQAAAERHRRIPVFEQRLSELRTDLATAEQTADEQILQRLNERYMHDRAQDDGTTVYRTFVLNDTYTLYVGRNAANNDELTMRFAKQNDWWLHARGVSGSHALLRGGGNERPPKDVLERAAAIAAYYSQARNASYTPVIYTQRKYVRKPKGANVGAVVVEREQVIMVKPYLPDAP